MYFMLTWNSLLSFGIFYGHFVKVVVPSIGIFSCSGACYYGKSGNPALLGKKLLSLNKLR
jgi:hypothetical protein